MFAINRSGSLALAAAAVLAVVTHGCAAPWANPTTQVRPRFSELTVLEIACSAAEREGLQLSDYNVPNIDYDAAGVWTVLFQRKPVSGPGNYFFVIVVDADGSVTLRRGVW